MTTNLTLLEVAKRTDPNGDAAMIAMILSQTNRILDDCQFKEGNLPTGERVTIQTGLPKTYFRSLNQGIEPSKGTTAQVDEGCALQEARSEVDLKVISLNGNSSEYRLQEAEMFLEAMNQDQAKTMIYGNPAVNPQEYLGLTQRYSDSSAANAQNIIDAGGTTANQLTSCWLIGWGLQYTYCVYPQGSPAGLTRRDLGEYTSFDAGATNLRLQVLGELYTWENGLVVKDWRANVRIANIDSTEFAGLSGNMDPKQVGAYTDLLHLMTRALGKVPESVQARSRMVFYMNASVYTVLMRAALEKSNNALNVEMALTQFGTQAAKLSFLGVPIRQVDQIVNTEAQVTGL